MDSLLKNSQARVAEEQRKKDEVELAKNRVIWRHQMERTIQSYEQRIKKMIEHVYETRAADIARMIQVCDELKTCSSPEQITSLKVEVETFRRSLDQAKKDELVIYEKLHGFGGGRIFPERWDNEVVQEWLNYWNFPIILGDTTLMKQCRDGGCVVIPGNTYHQKKRDGTLPIIIDQDYKGEYVWFDLGKTLLECHMWRQRYGLEHLDAIALHAK